MYVTALPSPLGQLYLASDGRNLTGLWLEGQRYFPTESLAAAQEEPDLPVFRQTEAWLAAYFSKAPLPALPPLRTQGSPFRQAVWQLLQEIPQGETTTYGALAAKLKARGIPASAQAVGGAVRPLGASAGAVENRHVICVNVTFVA